MAQRFTVYGIRVRGTSEVRYVGFTRFSPAERLTRHFVTGNYRRCFKTWLLDNRDSLEAFPIIKCRDKAVARAMEKAAIATSALLGHRLFNSDHVPAHLRIAA